MSYYPDRPSADFWEPERLHCKSVRFKSYPDENKNRYISNIGHKIVENIVFRFGDEII